MRVSKDKERNEVTVYFDHAWLIQKDGISVELTGGNGPKLCIDGLNVWTCSSFKSKIRAIFKIIKYLFFE